METASQCVATSQEGFEMYATDLLRQIQADGAELVLTPSGRLKLTGTHAERWLATIAQLRI